MGRVQIIVYIFVFLSNISFARDNYTFRHLAVEDGLSQNSVYAIIQDQKGFLWLGTQEGLNRYDGYSFKTYKKDNTKGSISDNNILCLYQCTNEHIWVGTRNGISIYNPKLDMFSGFNGQTIDSVGISVSVRDIQCDNFGNKWIAASSEGIFQYTIDNELIHYRVPAKIAHRNEKGDFRKIAIGIDNRIWLGTYTYGLCLVNREKGSVDRFSLGNEFNDCYINDLYFIDSQTLLIGTIHHGLLELNTKTGECKTLLKNDENGNPLFIRRILKRRNGELWLGTENGLCVYNLRTNKVDYFKHIFNDRYSIADNAIHSLFEDREGGMWLGTFFGGASYMSDSHSVFEKYYPVEGRNSISGKSIGEFCENENGNLWIGTEDFGLNFFNPSSNRFKNYYFPKNLRNSISHSNIHGLMYQNSELWIGTYSQGIDVLNTQTGQILNYKSSDKKNSLLSNNIYSIYRDSNETIWIGSEKGLQYFNPESKDFTRVNEALINCQVNDIHHASSGLLWVATIGEGVFCYSPGDKQWKNYEVSTQGNLTGRRMATCVLEDQNGTIWIGTEGAGMCYFNEKKSVFVSLNTSNGLPNNVVYMLVQDDQGNIWGSTNKGIFSYNPTSKEIRNFGYSSGLLGDQFNYKSGLLSNGKIYFGGVKGFIAFDPSKLIKNAVVPKVEITGISVNTVFLQPEGEDGILDHSISYTKKIRLKHDQNNLDISFAALSFVSPELNSYKYRMVGDNENWKSIKHNQTISYSNLKPGNYRFEVKASNSDAIWQEQPATLQISISQPFYQTKIAYLIVLAIIAGALYLIVHLNALKLKRKNKGILEKLNNEKEKEIFQSKIEFFTSITHEIRTPLSLIKTPLDMLMKGVEESNEFYPNLNAIQKNTDRLLDLTNQLLDFRKSEATDLKLNYQHIDVISLIKDIHFRFSPAAKSNSKELKFNTENKSFFADVDVEVLTKTLSNLINNGIKFAKDLIEIDFETDDEFFFLKVISNGELINEKDRERIFQPFYKIDENSMGSGLGLPLIKSLIQIHEGELYLETGKNTLNVFVVKLKILQESPFKIQQASFLRSFEAEVDEKEIDLKFSVRYTILLVEDNEELCYFMKQQFDDEFDILLASNGKVGYELLKSEQVDLIISDLMMPIMDGIELCEKVKEELEMSHIPFIMLSAQSSVQSKLKALNAGADDYIEKPYSYEFLQARIRNLLISRKKIKQLYLNSPEQDIKPIVHTKADEEFLTQLISVIHENLDDDGLDVEVLSKRMNMSRASLYRKVKGISELTPNDFIRLTRLKKASELLSEGKHRINEIAYIVGFSSPSYFSKCFHKQFGFLPKDFAKHN